MENKTGKYFKYAIGEIVLVVIGILIALQINNWNESRLLRIEEKAILSNLNREFSQNKKALISIMKQGDECYQAALTIMSLIGKNRVELEAINTDSLLSQSFTYSSFNPSENALSDLLQSGRLQLLQNEKLKDLLYQWSSSMKNAVIAYDDFDVKIENDLVPYLTNNHSLRDMGVYGFLNWKTKSVLKIDKLKIFEDIVYENLMEDMIWRLLANINYLKDVEKIIDNIIMETSSQ